LEIALNEAYEAIQLITDKLLQSLESMNDDNLKVVNDVIKKETDRLTKEIKDELFDRTVGLAKSTDIQLLHRNVLQSNKENLTVLSSYYNDIRNIESDIQETLVENTDKITTQSDKIDSILMEMHDIENNVSQTRKDIMDVNSLTKDELLLSTSNIITKENYNLTKQIELQIAARDGWMVNQIATPIGNLDKAVTINTQIECQIVEEQRNTKNLIINEMRDNTNSIISTIIPPVSERLDKVEEGLINLIHGSDTAKDAVLGQISNINEKMNELVRTVEEQHQSTPPAAPLNESGRNLTPENASPFYNQNEDDLETKIIKAIIKSEDGPHLERLLSQIGVFPNLFKEFDHNVHHKNLIQAMIIQRYFPPIVGHLCWKCHQTFYFQDHQLFFQHLISCGEAVCNCEFLSAL
jgi:hypothetical protein